MAAMSDFLENKIIDYLFRGEAFGVTGASAGVGSGPGSLFIALCADEPTDGNTGTEITGGSYARVEVESGMGASGWAGTNSVGSTAASTGDSGTTSNNGAINFPSPTANWGVITHFGIYDAATAGNLLFWGALTTPKTVNNGDAAPAFAPSSLSIQIDN